MARNQAQAIFDSTSELLLQKADIIEEVSADEYYMGFQSQGAAESDASWSIMHMKKTAGIWRRKWAGGSQRERLIWDNRASYTYTFKKA